MKKLLGLLVLGLLALVPVSGAEAVQCTDQSIVDYITANPLPTGAGYYWDGQYNQLDQLNWSGDATQKFMIVYSMVEANHVGWGCDVGTWYDTYRQDTNCDGSVGPKYLIGTCSNTNVYGSGTVIYGPILHPSCLAAWPTAAVTCDGPVGQAPQHPVDPTPVCP